MALLQVLGHEIEYDWVSPNSADGDGDGGHELDAGDGNGEGLAAPTLVFLHEGLGSAALWRGFPAAVCAATGRRGLVYSRPGYGGSSVVKDRRRTDYMHHEALEVLPEVLARLSIDRPILLGHSDGASIALIHAGARRWPVEALALLAPHVFVEATTVESIEAAAHAYRTTDLAQRMARHHRDADATFWGWNQVWLSEEFRSWNIEEVLGAIQCPVLVVQGENDEYGTLAQVEAIRQGVAGPIRTVVLPHCRHAPHLDQPDATLRAVVELVSGL